MADFVTQQHAFVIARDYNIAPYDELKTERVINERDLCSVWLAKKDRSARCFAKYHEDQLGPGLLCASCWGKDKPFGDRATPKIVTVLFRGITACPEYDPPPDGSFVEFVDKEIHMHPLIQDPDEPCLFTCEIPDWLNSETLVISWNACHNDISTLQAYLDPSGSAYFLKNCPVCQVFFENSYTECDTPTVVGYGGTGLIIF